MAVEVGYVARPTMDLVTKALSGPRCISLLGCLIAAVSSFFATLAIESVGQIGLVEELTRSLGVLLFTGCALWLANLIVRRKKANYQASPVLVVSMFVLIGGLRPIVSAAIGYAFAGESIVDSARIVMAIFTTSTGLIVLAVALEALDQSAKTIARLSRKRSELLALRTEKQQQVDFIRASLTSALLNPVIDTLMEIRDRLSKLGNGAAEEDLDESSVQIRAVAQDVKDLATKTVRTTSHEVAQSQWNLADPPEEALQVPESRRAAFWDSIDISPFYPLVVGLLVFGGFLLGLLRIFGHRGLIIGVVLGVATGVLLKLFELIYRSRLIALLPGTARYCLAIFCFAVAAALATILGAATARVLVGSDSRVSISFGATFFTIFTIILLVTIGFSAVKSQRLMITSLTDLTHLLEHEVGKKQVALERLRLTLARQLHGDVQSRLSAIALKLEWIADQEVANPESDESKQFAQIEAVADEVFVLARQLEELDTVSGREEIEIVVDELLNSWGAAIDLHIDLTPEAAVKLNETEEACRTVTEMMREGISNAVRHGGAQSVHIVIVSESDDWIAVSISDNGVGMDKPHQWGFGLTSLNMDVDQLNFAAQDNGGSLLTGRILTSTS